MVKKKAEFKSKTEFAKYCEVSPPAITKAIAAGNVIFNKKEKGIDIYSPINVEYQERSAHQRVNSEVKSSSKQVSGRDITKLEKWELTSQEIKDLRTLRQIEASELNNDIARGKYIDAELVIILLKNLEVVDQKQLMNLGRNSAPKVVTIMSGDESYISAVAAEIEGEAWKIIAEKKNMMEAFLEGLGD